MHLPLVRTGLARFARRYPAGARASVVAAVFALACAVPAARAAEELPVLAQYQPGQGVVFPEVGLRLGGYADLQFYDLHGQPRTARLGDLSLFIVKDLGPKAEIFAELETNDVIVYQDHRGSRARSDFDVERLYADYHVAPSLSLRGGKFLTPVGQWNLVHADPLTWTVSRPLTTSAAFARHATGVMAYGTLPSSGGDLDYWVYADDGAALRFGQDEDHAFVAGGADETVRNTFRHAIGARALYHLADESLSIGVSLLDFELAEPDRRYRLAGADFTWKRGDASVTGEAIYRTSNAAGVSDERGAFVQGLLPVPPLPNVSIVGRAEIYRSSVMDNVATIYTGGLVYRPSPAFVLKLERREGRGNALVAPSGWLASVGLLF